MHYNYSFLFLAAEAELLLEGDIFGGIKHTTAVVTAHACVRSSTSQHSRLLSASTPRQSYPLVVKGWQEADEGHDE